MYPSPLRRCAGAKIPKRTNAYALQLACVSWRAEADSLVNPDHNSYD